MRAAWAHGSNYDPKRLKFYTASRGFILGESKLGEKLGPEGDPVELAGDFTSCTISSQTIVESGLFVHREVEICQLSTTLPTHKDLRRARLIIRYDGVEVYRGTIRQAPVTESVEVGMAGVHAGNTAVKTYRVQLLATAGDEVLATAATPPRVFIGTESTADRLTSWTGLATVDNASTAAADVPVNVDNVGWQNTAFRRVGLADELPSLLDSIRNEIKIRNRTFTYKPWETFPVQLWPNNRWLNGATTAATALRITDSPAVDTDTVAAMPGDQYIHAGRNVSYSTLATSEDPAQFADSASVSLILNDPPNPDVAEKYGPYRASTLTPSDVDIALGELDFTEPTMSMRTARNLVGTLPLKRSTQSFPDTITMPLQSSQQFAGPVPGLALLDRDGVTERVAILGVTHAITPNRWQVSYKLGPQHLLSRDSDYDPGTPRAISAAYGADLMTFGNYGFEVDTSGWAGSLGGTITRETVVAHSGVACGRVTTDGAVAAQGAFSPTAAVAASTQYTAAIWIRGAVGGETVLISAISNPAMSTFAGPTTVVLTTAWQRIVVTGTTPVGATSVQIITRTTTAVAQSWFVDDAALRPGAVAASEPRVSPRFEISWATPNLPSDVTLYRRVFAAATPGIVSNFISWDTFYSMPLAHQIVMGEHAGDVQTLDVQVPAGFPSGYQFPLFVAYSSNPKPADVGDTPTDAYREGQPAYLGTVTLP